MKKTIGMKNTCGFCSVQINDNIENVAETHIDMMQIVLPDLPPATYKHSKICKACDNLVKDIFNFKSTCLEIEDNIHNYTTDDLKQINLEKIIGLADTGCNNNSRICRTCFEVIDDDLFVFINKSGNSLFQQHQRKCLPEIDISLTKEPVMCIDCVEMLQKYFNFLNQYIRNHESIPRLEKLNKGDYLLNNPCETDTVVHHKQKKIDLLCDSPDKTEAVVNHKLKGKHKKVDRLIESPCKSETLRHKHKKTENLFDEPCKAEIVRHCSISSEDIIKNHKNENDKLETDTENCCDQKGNKIESKEEHIIEELEDFSIDINNKIEDEDAGEICLISELTGAALNNFDQVENNPDGFDQNESAPDGFNQNEIAPDGFDQHENVPDDFDQDENISGGFEQDENVPDGLDQCENVPDIFDQDENVPDRLFKCENVPDVFDQNENVPDRLNQDTVADFNHTEIIMEEVNRSDINSNENNIEAPNEMDVDSDIKMLITNVISTAEADETSNAQNMNISEENTETFLNYSNKSTLEHEAEQTKNSENDNIQSEDDSRFDNDIIEIDVDADDKTSVKGDTEISKENETVIVIDSNEVPSTAMEVNQVENGPNQNGVQLKETDPNKPKKPKNRYKRMLRSSRKQSGESSSNVSDDNDPDFNPRGESESEISDEYYEVDSASRQKMSRAQFNSSYYLQCKYCNYRDITELRLDAHMSICKTLQTTRSVPSIQVNVWQELQRLREQVTVLQNLHKNNECVSAPPNKKRRLETSLTENPSTSSVNPIVTSLLTDTDTDSSSVDLETDSFLKSLLTNNSNLISSDRRSAQKFTKSDQNIILRNLLDSSERPPVLDNNQANYLTKLIVSKSQKKSRQKPKQSHRPSTQSAMQVTLQNYASLPNSDAAIGQKQQKKSHRSSSSQNNGFLAPYNNPHPDFPDQYMPSPSYLHAPSDVPRYRHILPVQPSPYLPYQSVFSNISSDQIASSNVAGQSSHMSIISPSNYLTRTQSRQRSSTKTPRQKSSSVRGNSSQNVIRPFLSRNEERDAEFLASVLRRLEQQRITLPSTTCLEVEVTTISDDEEPVQTVSKANESLKKPGHDGQSNLVCVNEIADCETEVEAPFETEVDPLSLEGASVGEIDKNLNKHNTLQDITEMDEIVNLDEDDNEDSSTVRSSLSLENVPIDDNDESVSDDNEGQESDIINLEQDNSRDTERNSSNGTGQDKLKLNSKINILSVSVVETEQISVNGSTYISADEKRSTETVYNAELCSVNAESTPNVNLNNPAPLSDAESREKEISSAEMVDSDLTESPHNISNSAEKEPPITENINNNLTESVRLAQYSTTNSQLPEITQDNEMDSVIADLEHVLATENTDTPDSEGISTTDHTVITEKIVATDTANLNTDSISEENVQTDSSTESITAKDNLNNDYVSQRTVQTDSGTESTTAKDNLNNVNVSQGTVQTGSGTESTTAKDNLYNDNVSKGTVQTDSSTESTTAKDNLNNVNVSQGTVQTGSGTESTTATDNLNNDNVSQGNVQTDSSTESTTAKDNLNNVNVSQGTVQTGSGTESTTATDNLNNDNVSQGNVQIDSGTESTTAKDSLNSDNISQENIQTDSSTELNTAKDNACNNCDQMETVNAEMSTINLETVNIRESPLNKEKSLEVGSSGVDSSNKCDTEPDVFDSNKPTTVQSSDTAMDVDLHENDDEDNSDVDGENSSHGSANDVDKHDSGVELNNDNETPSTSKSSVTSSSHAATSTAEDRSVADQVTVELSDSDTETPTAVTQSSTENNKSQNASNQPSTCTAGGPILRKDAAYMILNEHMLNHHVLLIFKCDRCPFNTRYFQLIDMHVLTHFQMFLKDKEYGCNRCSKKFPNKFRLFGHFQNDHEHYCYKLLFWCVNCAKVFTKKLEVRRHFKTCPRKEISVKLFKSNDVIYCMYCNYETTNVDKAKVHARLCITKRMQTPETVVLD